jgi:hypothetical protein
MNVSTIDGVEGKAMKEIFTFNTPILRPSAIKIR